MRRRSCGLGSMIRLWEESVWGRLQAPRLPAFNGVYLGQWLSMNQKWAANYLCVLVANEWPKYLSTYDWVNKNVVYCGNYLAVLSESSSFSKMVQLAEVLPA